MFEKMDRERCEILAEYMIEMNATVRSVASAFAISKSTVHKDITTKLKEINPDLYDKVKGVLDTNKSERHLRGGEATRVKYLHKKALMTSEKRHCRS
jgi:putative DeoR family transcriptional regulator (stage III sporulation protein D)